MTCGFHLGTITPLTIGIATEYQWGIRFVVNLEKMFNYIYASSE